MKSQAPISGRKRRSAVHALRVLLFVAIVLLIRVQHRAVLAAGRENGLGPVPLQRVQQFMPSAVSVRNSADIEGAGEILDANGGRLGSVIQTSPDSDPVIGFSGPSNLLMVFDTQGRIVGLDVLSSRDTPEHAAQGDERSAISSSFQWTHLGRSSPADAG